MLRRIQFFPECNADTALIGFLLNDNETLYRHSQGSNVSGDMVAASQEFDIVVGIMDNDKTSTARYFDDFQWVSEGNNVRLLKKPEKEIYLILIVGRKVGIETFLRWNAEQVGINLSDYGFLIDYTKKGKKKFSQFKKEAMKTDPNYRRLLTDLRALNAPGLITLQTLLHDLFPA